jgi:hypothetical protein
MVQSIMEHGNKGQDSRARAFLLLFKKELLLILGMLLVAIFVSGYELKLLRTQLLIQDMIRNGLDYEAFRKFQVSEASIDQIREEINHLLKNKPELTYKSFYSPKIFSIIFSQFFPNSIYYPFYALQICYKTNQVFVACLDGSFYQFP